MKQTGKSYHPARQCRKSLEISKDKLLDRIFFLLWLIASGKNTEGVYRGGKNK